MNIALMGRARSGKDTVASHLVENFGYRRVAFADPLKEMALEADPIVSVDYYGEQEIRLGEEVARWGWEAVKDEWPYEVRSFLQNLGSAVRDVLGDNTWLRRGMCTAYDHQLAGHPVVFTDVRYYNEATALRHAGYTMVRIVRPASQSGDMHPSETELDDYAADYTLTNYENDVRYLLTQVEGLVR